MKVLYFTCFEVTKGCDIHRNQVLALQGNGVDYSYLFITPLIILNRKGFSWNNNKFERDDVKEYKIPMVSYPFYLYIPLVPILLLLCIPILLWRIKKDKIGIIHCRNLLSTLCALVLKRTFHLKIKIVCDPRSVYVEEGVIYKVFKYQSWTYKKWKKIEEWCYRNSDACLGLSTSFANYLKQYNQHSLFIPAIVSNNYCYDDEKRKKMRKNQCLSDNDFVAIYVGSIGSWHSIDSYIKMLVSLKQNIKKNFKIVLLTGNQRAISQVKEAFSEEDILKVGRVSPSEVLDYLLLADYGILPGSDISGYEYDLLYKTMLSSKVEEYLSAGLPVLVNKRIEAVAHLVDKYKCGTVYDEHSFVLNKDIDRELFSNELRSLFCAKNVVMKYNELYKDLIGL